MARSFLPAARPESAGLSSHAVEAFVAAAEERLDALHSLLIVRHGAVLAEGYWAPYEAATPHMLFSLSKSFTSTAAGLAIAEGRLALDDRLVDAFPEALPATVSDHLAAMRLRHLLSMSTGHSEDTLTHLVRDTAGDWVRTFLSCPVTHPPGTHFLYNSGATYVVSAWLQRLTGQRLVDYLRPRLFDPLGIGPATWDTCPRGIDTGGWGLNLTTRDLARFAHLLLEDGCWQGRRLLPAGWVTEATRWHVANGDDPQSDWAQGYGFQFWRSRHGCYRGDGAFGQFLVVLPQQAAAVVMTAGLGNMQEALNLVWEHLLPAFDDVPRPADPAADRLAARLAALRLPAPAAGGGSAPPETWELEPNDLGWVRLRLDSAAGRLTVGTASGEHEVCFGTAGEWRATAPLPLPPPPGLAAPSAGPAAASGGWPDATEFRLRVWLTATPFRHDLVWRPDAARGQVEITQNLAFGPALKAVCSGRLVTDPRP
ncbi:MAG: serine hydrolase [Fimbriimonadaceae bacterium]|nr:serine hydrolase [Fimbriimonadaceae bacterium]